MDSRGTTSDQIDLLVYDAQYTPLLAQTSSGDLFVPAEAVYAVFEVKQEMNKTFMDYAGTKIASVRRLHRTSVPIAHAGGVYPPKRPIAILGGLPRPGRMEADLQGEAAVKAVLSLSGDRAVNLGCALRAVSFNRPDDPDSVIEYSESDTTLLFSCSASSPAPRTWHGRGRHRGLAWNRSGLERRACRDRRGAAGHLADDTSA